MKPLTLHISRLLCFLSLLLSKECLVPAVCTYAKIPLDIQRCSATSGVATPGHTWAHAHVKFTGAWVKIMWKAKVTDQLLACAIAFMWT